MIFPKMNPANSHSEIVLISVNIYFLKKYTGVAKIAIVRKNIIFFIFLFFQKTIWHNPYALG